MDLARWDRLGGILWEDIRCGLNKNSVCGKNII
jgi:hypothetical protein